MLVRFSRAVADKSLSFSSFSKSLRFMSTNNPDIPFCLTTELTYRCPLQCPYCSNPVEMAKRNNELSTQEWVRVFTEARKLGAVQLGLTGGEPLLREDLEELVKEATQLGFYTNLITSGVGLTEKRLRVLKDNGLKAVQVSFQAENEELNNFISGLNSFKHKMRSIKRVKDFDLPLTLNVVLHRFNIEQMKEILDLCISLNPDYIELANAQYYGFALKNRTQLLPTNEQIFKAKKVSLEYQKKYQEKPRIFYVIPDYIEGKPKPCMTGWGKTYICVAPDGVATPCLSARILPDLKFPNVKETSVSDIWNDSEIFNKYRGTDYQGCRCQAFMLTGSPENIDPVSKESPEHGQLMKIITEANKVKPDINKLVFRNMDESEKFIQENKKTGKKY